MAQIKATKCLLGVILKSAGISQQELGKQVGVSRGQIGDWITMRSDRTMPVEIARRIVTVLKLESPYDLYEWENVPPSGRTDE